MNRTCVTSWARMAPVTGDAVNITKFLDNPNLINVALQATQAHCLLCWCAGCRLFALTNVSTVRLTQLHNCVLTLQRSRQDLNLLHKDECLDQQAHAHHKLAECCHNPRHSPSQP
jgi:hypothetical protein